MDPKDEQNDLAAYAAAFDEDMMPPRDEEAPAGGITPSNEDAPAQSDGATGGEPAAVVLAVADGEQIEQAQGDAAADATTTTADEDLDDAPLDPKEEQRRRSWEGRLRAREAELERKEAELRTKGGQVEMPRAESGESGESQQTEAMEQAADQLAASGDKEGAEAVEQVAEQVESGELTAAQAMKILADDFGEDFVKLISTIAGAQAKEAAGKIAQEATGQFGQTLEQVIGNIADDRERAHFEAIADAHPDFLQVSEAPEFNEFIKQYPDGERIAEGGSAREIVKLLSKFKEANKPAPTEPDPALDAAQGVRSGGMRLPEAPVKAEGYEDAWNQY